MKYNSKTTHRLKRKQAAARLKQLLVSMMLLKQHALYIVACGNQAAATPLPVVHQHLELLEALYRRFLNPLDS